MLRIVQENKLALKFPCLKEDLSKGNDDPKVLSNLMDFYGSVTGRNKYADKNVLMQLRLYLGMHQRCFGIVCSLNCWSFVKLDEDGTMHVSKRYMANEPETLEILIRFICAAIGDQERDGDNPFGVMRDRPDFIKEWATALFGKEKADDLTIFAKTLDDDDDDESDRGRKGTSKKRGAGKGKSTTPSTGGDGSSSSGGAVTGGNSGGFFFVVIRWREKKSKFANTRPEMLERP